ncbi:MAG: hypothetical protein KF799_00840 [Bdellovibrionales bacterium]|nr:hypothetical protein [Bdellovibrionales bacterium]
MKLAELKALSKEIAFADTPSLGLRDRVDLIWEDGRLGLYALAKREVLDLENCAMMSPALEAFFKAYRERKPPVRKGSVRLRVSPTGARGVWLDFANQDVKTLFDEKTYLQWLSSMAFVEIGQRRKALVWRDGAPKLTDPILQPWFETYDANMRSIPLYGPVGGFSQAGFVANRALVSEVARQVEASGLSDWVELFSGNGNFALALAARGKRVTAVELDSFAIQGLERSKAERPELALEVQRADAYLKAKTLPALKGRGLLVDPPRAGLRQVLDWLAEGERPQALVYVSCFTDVFVQEAEKLRQLGYKLEQLRGVDQFPHSAHAEWIALFTFAGL